MIDLLSFDNVIMSRAAVDVLESYLGQAGAAVESSDAADEEAE